MLLKLFNTLTKKKEEFNPIEEGRVKFYTCGPTVYDRPHIGNYASFLMADLLRRWLEVIGFKIVHVKNITDVGHLTADQNADAGGEDKVEKKAREEKVDPLEIAKRYTEQYLEDEKALNMIEPEHRPLATETIPEMISIVKNLVEKGNAYETEDGIYFSVESFEGYGKLSGNTLANLGKLETGVRVEMKESKKHPADFALWKKCAGENSDHVLRWSYPEGKRVSGVGEDSSAGFPGWHIECSAMSTKFLGEEIDIHTGGEDNIFPHHECEIAQSECAYGKPFVRYWLHKRRVNFGDPSINSGRVEKMSKSLGNVLNLSDIVEKGFSALDLRYLFLSSHYRSHTQFTWKGLEDARKARLRVVEWMADAAKTPDGVETPDSAKPGRASPPEENASENPKGIKGFSQKFVNAMNDDLNTPEALAVVFDAMAWSRNQQELSNEERGEISEFAEMIEKTFGCFRSESFDIPAEIKKIVEEREEVRRAGDYQRSDKLRDEAKAKGFVIEDLPDGPKILPIERRG